jgi:outer membrane protein OmpA-like peptidoglycan-associated protein
MIAAATFAANVSAQNEVITANKFGDNWYWGLNAGVTTNVKESYKDAGNGFFKALAPTVGLRIGKNLTTVFGLAVEGEVYTQSNDKWNGGSKTFIEQVNANLLGTFNLSNLFGGYKGEPRVFEIIGLYGFGWKHQFNHASKVNGLSSKVAVDFAFNLGSKKALQLYIEPALNYGLAVWGGGSDAAEAPMKYDLSRSTASLKLGLNYKFNTSNGTHNFAKAQLRDQAEIDGLNAQINSLRADNNAKDGKIASDSRTIADLQQKLTACQNQPKQVETKNNYIVKENSQLPPMVVFNVGKSSIDAAQYATIEMIAKYMKNHKDSKITIKGFASSEGDQAKNQKLSEDRANAVKQALVKRYKIDENRLTAEGMGATDAISTDIAFNRVAMFIDETIK